MGALTPCADATVPQPHSGYPRAMRFGAFTFTEVGLVAWAVAQSLVTIALVVYLVLLARRHVRAQERIADALERVRNGESSAPR